MKKTHRVIKKNIFRQLRHHRRCIDIKKKSKKGKKNFAPFWTSRGGGHVTTLPPILAGGDKNQILEMNYTHLGTHAGGYCKALCEKIRS